MCYFEFRRPDWTSSLTSNKWKIAKRNIDWLIEGEEVTICQWSNQLVGGAHANSWFFCFIRFCAIHFQFSSRIFAPFYPLRRIVLHRALTSQLFFLLSICPLLSSSSANFISLRPYYASCIQSHVIVWLRKPIYQFEEAEIVHLLCHFLFPPNHFLIRLEIVSGRNFQLHVPLVIFRNAPISVFILFTIPRNSSWFRGESEP